MVTTFVLKLVLFNVSSLSSEDCRITKFFNCAFCASKGSRKMKFAMVVTYYIWMISGPFITKNKVLIRKKMYEKGSKKLQIVTSTQSQEVLNGLKKLCWWIYSAISCSKIDYILWLCHYPAGRNEKLSKIANFVILIGLDT